MNTKKRVVKGVGILCCVAWLVAGETAQAGYGGFWRNAFESKSSWLTLNADAHHSQAVAHLALSQLAMGLTAVSFTAAPLVVFHSNRAQDEVSEIVTACGAAASIPDAPTISRVEPSVNGLKIFFDYTPRNSNRYRSFTLYYFASGAEKPRIVSAFCQGNYGPHDPDEFILDPNPETTGAGFYAMTTSTSVTPSSVALEQWWADRLSEGSGGGSLYLEYMFRRHVGWTSDYSEPYVVNNFPVPVTGGIDAVAVHPGTGDIYLSIPQEKKIRKITNEGETLSDPADFVNTGFASPGQKGLAIHQDGALYTDNAASDALYGGRLFSFSSTGSRAFTGTLNYFSQLLGYANPVSSGPMTMGYDGHLYVFEAISREVKQVPVAATYDPYRRVGHMYYGYGETENANLIDLDCGAGYLFGPGFLYILDSAAIKGLPLNLPSGVRGISFDTIPLD
jgi:hypothetical protein